MKRYKVTYELHNKIYSTTIRSDTFLNAYKIASKGCEYNEILKIELIT